MIKVIQLGRLHSNWSPPSFATSSKFCEEINCVRWKDTLSAQIKHIFIFTTVAKSKVEYFYIAANISWNRVNPLKLVAIIAKQSDSLYFVLCINHKHVCNSGCRWQNFRKIFKNIQKPSGIFRNLQESSGTFRNLQEPPSTSWNIL